MRRMFFVGLLTASVIARAAILYGDDVRTYSSGGLTISHAAKDEGTYFDTVLAPNSRGIG